MNVQFSVEDQQKLIELISEPVERIDWNSVAAGMKGKYTP